LSAITDAVTKRQFELFYEPQVDLKKAGLLALRRLSDRTTLYSSLIDLDTLIVDNRSKTIKVLVWEQSETTVLV